MSRELGVSGYEGDVTEKATEPLLIELAQDGGGMGRVRHLCGGGHGASLTAQPAWSGAAVAQQVPCARPLPPDCDGAASARPGSSPWPPPAAPVSPASSSGSGSGSGSMLLAANAHTDADADTADSGSFMA